MPYIKVGEENSGDIKLHYEDHGSGKPVVMVHGFPLNGSAWEKQEPALLEAGHRVITYDRRGFGKSSQPAVGYDYDTFASDLNAIMTELDLSQATLVGHSMGTGEVTRYLSKFGSERVAGAVLVSPVPPFLLKTKDNPNGLDRTVFENFQKTVRADRFVFLMQFLVNFFNLDVTRGKTVSNEVVRCFWAIGAGASAIATYECIGTWMTDFRQDLPRITVPTTIIQGTADRVLPYALCAPLAQKAIPGSRLVPIEGASHGIPWTHADVVTREILDLLARTEMGKAA